VLAGPAHNFEQDLAQKTKMEVAQKKRFKAVQPAHLYKKNDEDVPYRDPVRIC
jgi:hypothetical protein